MTDETKFLLTTVKGVTLFFEMNGGKTVLQNIEALGFEPFKLLEEDMFLCED